MWLTVTQSLGGNKPTCGVLMDINRCTLFIFFTVNTCMHICWYCSVEVESKVSYNFGNSIMIDDSVALE